MRMVNDDDDDGASKSNRVSYSSSHLCIAHSYSIRCDKTNRSGDAILFELALRYPSELPCQTMICQIRFFIETKAKFNTVFHVNITATDGRTISLELCRVDNNAGISDSNVDNTNLILFGEYSFILSIISVGQALTTSNI